MCVCIYIHIYIYIYIYIYVRIYINHLDVASPLCLNVSFTSTPVFIVCVCIPPSHQRCLRRRAL